MMFERRNSMEPTRFYGSIDQPISPYKSHIRNPKKINQFSIYENFMPSNLQNMGLLQAHPLLFHSYPPYSIQPSQQPPLLPLPTANPRHGSAMIARGLSCPPPSKKSHNNNRTKDPSFTSKKSKSPTKSPKKEGKISPKKSSSVIVSSTSPLGPDPKDLEKNVAKVLPLIISTGNANTSINGVEKNRLSSVKSVEDQMDVFSGSVVFTISPPPSSLPLPTFSLRPKLSCKSEAAGIDSGATDDLRRLLRLPELGSTSQMTI